MTRQHRQEIHATIPSLASRKGLAPYATSSSTILLLRLTSSTASRKGVCDIFAVWLCTSAPCSNSCTYTQCKGAVMLCIPNVLAGTYAPADRFLEGARGCCHSTLQAGFLVTAIAREQRQQLHTVFAAWSLCQCTAAISGVKPVLLSTYSSWSARLSVCKP